MPLNELAHRWLEKAEEDFGFFCCCLNDPDTNYFSQICFHFQQAGDKFLKVYIVAYRLEFRKIHDLPELLRICEAHDKSMSSIRDACEFLTDFYADTRYPVHWPSNISRQEVEKAREAATSIREVVRKRLKV